VSTTHDDPLYRVQPAAREWRLAELHLVATGRNVRVAVIDSMIEKTHPDLTGQVQMSENFVTGRSDEAEQHGTGVAGIIAALADNGLGIAGVAPRARLLALRACWQESAPRTSSPTTVCDSLSLAEALHFAIDHNAQVINLSLSGPPDRLLGRLLDAAMARGITVVGAFDRNLPGGGFPASHPGVVAVIDESQGAAPSGVFSAPGRDIPTTQPGGRWYLVSGSSYAAAHVSGLFALLRERAPRAQGSGALVTNATGEAIDACATLLRAGGPCECACPNARPALAIVRR
jgi:subtilisin family serine protease